MQKQKKTCANCLKGTTILINNDILCRDNGVVSPDFVCSKHHLLPAAVKASSESNNKCADCVNFILGKNSEKASPIGLCRLFSVRQFNGSEKKACSKFEKRSELEVS